MVRYILTMLREQPITFLVMLLMIGLVAFGVWTALPTPKKSSAIQPEAGRMWT